MRPSCRRALALVAAALPAPAWAASAHVPDDAATIAEALTMVGEWDTIYVDAARYAGEPPVTVDFNVQIESMDGTPVSWPQFVVVDATLRLGTGWIYGDQVVEGTAASGVTAAEAAAVLVLDGTFQGEGLTIYGLYGYAVYAVDSDVSLDASFVQDALYSPAVKLYNVYDDVYLDLTDTVFAWNANGAVYVLNAAPVKYVTVDVTRCAFEGNTAYESGADLRAYSVDAVTITGGTFDGATAGAAGGSLYAYDSNLLVDGSTFGWNTAPDGGSIYALSVTSTHTLTLQGARFEGGTATRDEGTGAEVAADGVDLVLDGVEALGGHATYGGFLYATSGTLVVRDSTLWSADAYVGGSLFLNAMRSATLTGTSLCGNTADYGAAIYAADSRVEVDTSVLHLNEAGYGAAVEIAGGTLTLVDDTFVVNPAPQGATLLGDASGEIVNTLFSGSYTGVTLEGSGNVTEAGYNLYWALDVPDAGYSTLGGDVYEDPLFAPSFDTRTCGSEPWLAAGSPAVDAGDPTRTDDDGSRSDIGAYPGEGDVVGPDTGDTGWVGPDTGDTGAETGGSETGAPDADGDGVPDGDDCAPDDPAIHPGATDDPFDDIDQDCDGDAASGTARGGCGCGVPPPGGGGASQAGTGVGAWFAGLVLVGVLVGRRRGGAGAGVIGGPGICGIGGAGGRGAGGRGAEGEASA